MLLGAITWAAFSWPDYAGERVQAAAGAARAIDGDSLELRLGERRVEIRLDGIDAPEYRQSCRRADGTAWPCGAEAFAALSALALEPGLDCGLRAEDRYHRTIARCRTARTQDIGAAMVLRGLAIATGRGSAVLYSGQQYTAERARRGLWQGDFDQPAAWRAANPRS
jgi:endonuclease YncB( thermonuclease family)